MSELTTPSTSQLHMSKPGFDRALVTAAGRNHLELMTLLVENGANVNGDSNTSQETPLYAAAAYGYTDAMTYLIRHGANVNATVYSTQETALHRTVKSKKASATRLLLENGADPNVATTDGMTPLHFAVMQNAPELVEMLLTHGARIDAKDDLGRTPCSLTQDADMKMLLEGRGTDPRSFPIVHRALQLQMNKEDYALLYRLIDMHKPDNVNIVLTSRVCDKYVGFVDLFIKHHDRVMTAIQNLIHEIRAHKEFRKDKTVFVTLPTFEDDTIKFAYAFGS